jgi:uncharacterized protein YkwD
VDVVFLLLGLLSGAPSMQTAMLGGVNDERVQSGVHALTLDACLSTMAADRARDMVQRHYFSHVTPDGRTPWDFMHQDGCPFRYAAENIAEATTEDEALTELWNSPEHRRNTLDAHYVKVGIGVATESDGTNIFVEDFTD